MAIVFIIIAIALFILARLFYRAADRIDDADRNSSKHIQSNSEINKTMSGSPSNCLPLYQNLSHKEKLNCMSLMFLCSGLAKTPHARQESQKLIAFISKCVGISLEEVKNYLQKTINASEDDSFMDDIIQMVSSIQDKNVIDMVAFNCYALWSFEPLVHTEERVLEIIHKLGYSDQEFEELLQRQKAISDTLL